MSRGRKGVLLKRGKGFPGGSDNIKNLTAMQETWVQSLGWEDPLEEGMVTPWQPIENPHGQRSLEGYSPWGCKESDTTEGLSTAQGEGKCSLGPPFTSPLTSLHLLGHSWITCLFMKQLRVHMMEQVSSSQRWRGEMERWKSKLKPKWPGSIRRREIMEGKMMTFVKVLLMWGI